MVKLNFKKLLTMTASLIVSSAVLLSNPLTAEASIYQEIPGTYKSPTVKFVNVFYGENNYVNNRFDIQVTCPEVPSNAKSSIMYYSMGLVNSAGQVESNPLTKITAKGAGTYNLQGLVTEGNTVYFRTYVEFYSDTSPNNNNYIGSTGTSASMDFSCDMSKPTIKSVKNNDGLITISAEDKISDPQYYGFVINNENQLPQTWALTNTFKPTQKGIYYCYVKDKAGNISDRYAFNFSDGFISIADTNISYSSSVAYEGKRNKS